MAIKGREQRRLARVGKIHRGVKVKTKSGDGERPSAIDHFLVRADDTTPEASAKAFHEVYKPCSRCNDGEDVECNGADSIDVMFPTDDPAQWADEFYRMYSGSLQLVCRGDGEVAFAKWSKTAKGKTFDGAPPGSWASANSTDWETTKIPCNGPDCPMQAGAKPACKITMNLQFLLPKVRGIGVWQADLGGIHSINNIRDCIETIKAVTHGRIRGIPLTLSIRPKSVTPKGEKKKTVWVLDLSLPDVSLNDFMRQAASLPENMLMIPPPMDDSEEPEGEEPEEVLTGETYEHGSTDKPHMTRAPNLARGEDPGIEETRETRKPDAVETAPEPKKTKAKPKAPAEVVKENAGPAAKDVSSVDDLTAYEPANVGELYNAGWSHFRMTRVLIEEIAAAEIRDKRFGDAWRKVCSAKNAEQKAEPFA